MCNGGCGGCASKCGSSVKKEIPVKNLHPEQVKQIKNLFVQYVQATDLILPIAVGKYEIESIFQSGKIIAVLMNALGPGGTSGVTFHFQI